MDSVLWWPGWLTLSVLACWAGLALSSSFAVRYHLRTHGAWMRTPEGRWTLGRRVVEALVLGLTLINFYFPGWPGVLPVSFLVLALFALQIYTPHHLLNLAYRKDDHGRDPGRGDTSPKDGAEDEGGKPGIVRGRVRVAGRARHERH